jgi:hypothetical protein
VNRAVGDDGVTVNGGHAAFGAAPASSFSFAEGTVLPDFATYLTLANPSARSTATATITYFLTDGTKQVRTADIAPRGRRTVRVFDASDPAGLGRNVSDPAGRGVSMSVTTTAEEGIVAERPVYFHHSFAVGVPEINDAHDTPGAAALAFTWQFAEGSTLPGFYPFLTILNPGDSPAPISITYAPDAGPRVVRSVTAAPTSRLTVQVFGPPGQGGIGGEVTGFGIEVATNVPVLVERPLYVYREIPGLPVINGGSDVIGFAA